MSSSDASLTTLTRSPTPHVLMLKPRRRCASTLSPSVTATSRMLSPKRQKQLAGFVSEVYDLPASPEQLARVAAAVRRREEARWQVFQED